MPNNEIVSSVENDRVLVLERVFDAPRDLVFRMFKEAEHLKRWWGPKGWEILVCNIDFRPGGVWHYCMKCVDQNQGQFYGMESWGKGVYKEIVEPEMIIYTDYFSDAEGNINESMPSSLITMQFVDLGGKTKLVNRAEYVSAEALKNVTDMGVVQGITETWNRLDELLKSFK
jgi:uncharacterized protein YndB with AHSA1/START domain